MSPLLRLVEGHHHLGRQLSSRLHAGSSDQKNCPFLPSPSARPCIHLATQFCVVWCLGLIWVGAVTIMGQQANALDADKRADDERPACGNTLIAATMPLEHENQPDCLPSASPQRLHGQLEDQAQQQTHTNAAPATDVSPLLFVAEAPGAAAAAQQQEQQVQQQQNPQNNNHQGAPAVQGLSQPPPWLPPPTGQPPAAATVLRPPGCIGLSLYRLKVVGIPPGAARGHIWRQQGCAHTLLSCCQPD